MTAYTNTVLQKPFAQSTGLANLWDMFLYNGSQTYLKSQIRLFGATTADNDLELIPSTGYNITIFPPSPESFQLDWNGAPPAGYDTVVILRQVYGAYQEFLPGAFLSAEALNLRFNLLTLAANDLQFYQYKATPTYKPQAIYEHGKSQTDLSEGMEAYDLELPFLPGDVASAVGDVWTWGKEIITPGAPHGIFKPVLLHTSTSGTLPAFKADLLLECPSATSGGHLIGICAPAGSFGGQSQKLNTFIADALPHNAATTNSGAKIIGLNIDGGNQAGSTNVQDFCNQLHVESPTNQSGAAGIGYDGWGLPGPLHTVASCFDRLNDPATSAADSGANHVQYWTGTQSESVQSALGYFEFSGPATGAGNEDIDLVYPGYPPIYNDPARWTRVEVDWYETGGIYHYTSVFSLLNGLITGQYYWAPAATTGANHRYELSLHATHVALTSLIVGPNPMTYLVHIYAQ